MTQNNPKIIGITGGIASGKSTVTRILKNKNYNVVDADLIAREILEVGQDAYKDVIDDFGEEILNDDKSINRKALGNKIFSNIKSRELLNKITHPYIIKRIKEEIKDSKDDIIFLDIALLIEIHDDLKKNAIYIDEIWLVYCDKETQVSRLMKRDNIDKDMAQIKVISQIDIEEKKQLSDKIIDNRLGIDELTKNVEMTIKEIS